MKKQPFQVNTLGIPEVKRLLIDLYVKAGGKNDYNESNFDSEFGRKCGWLQFWFGAFCGYHIKPYISQSELCPIFTLEQAIEYLTGLLKKESKTIQLNDDYSAKIVEGQDFVTVGCQSFAISKIEELYRAIQEMKEK